MHSPINLTNKRWQFIEKIIEPQLESENIYPYNAFFLNSKDNLSLITFDE
ncbi:MAG: hypothetical protein H6Q13_2930 [Bacteroidetes bacterium]|nr:hypothetical protein [Bacteroidota bacterium]